jgi:alpha-glucosidase
MRVNDDFKKWNVESQVDDKESVLSYWKEMLTLRKKEADVFVYGKFEMVPAEKSGADVLAYTMTELSGEKRALVLLNFSDRKQRFDGDGFENWTRLIGDNPSQSIRKGGVGLRAYKGVVFSNWTS